MCIADSPAEPALRRRERREERDGRENGMPSRTDREAGREGGR